MRKKKCTEMTTGVVEAIMVKGLDFPTVIDVRYSVQEKEYTVKESLKLKNIPIKVGKLPTGQKKVPVLGPVQVGMSLPIRYNPLKPQKAYIVGNDGAISC